jgi:hypothetical protein
MGGDGLKLSNRCWKEDGMGVEKMVEEAQVEKGFGAYLPRRAMQPPRYDYKVRQSQITKVPASPFYASKRFFSAVTS